MTWATTRPCVALPMPRSRYSKNERSPRSKVASLEWVTVNACTVIYGSSDRELAARSIILRAQTGAEPNEDPVAHERNHRLDVEPEVTVPLQMRTPAADDG